MNSELDEIFLKGKGRVVAPPKSDPLDEALSTQKQAIADELKVTQAQEIVTNRRKNIAQTEREIAALRGNGAGAAVDAATTEVSAKSQAALLDALIKSGTDPTKANEFLKNLDQEVMAKLLVLSGSSTGSNSLVPLLLLARQPTTSVTEIITAAEKITNMVPKTAGNANPTMLELTEAMINLKELSKTDSSGFDAAFQELKAGQDALRETMHQRDLQHAQEMAAQREQMLTNELAQIRQELVTLKSRNLKQELNEAKSLMEGLGFKISTGTEKGPDLEKVMDTVMGSPAVKDISSAVGDAIRTRAAGRGASTAMAAQSAPESFFCQVCAQRGVRTNLKITPEAAAGKASIVCPNCGTEYSRPAG